MDRQAEVPFTDKSVPAINVAAPVLNLTTKPTPLLGMAGVVTYAEGETENPLVDCVVPVAKAHVSEKKD